MKLTWRCCGPVCTAVLADTMGLGPQVEKNTHDEKKKP